VHPCYRQLQINQQKTMTTKDKEFIGLSFRSYNRKSSEQDERQALSIDSQIEQNQKTAENYGIKLTKDSIIKESKSAKKSSTRPEFMILIKEIRRGTVQGIIVWHPDRLSRNAGDAGTLIDLMDEEKLKVIITKQQVFRNTPSDKFFFSMLCSQAKMENDSKGENVKRGLVKKRKMGYPTGLAKIGYENDGEEKGFKKIIEDKQRFPIVKKVFEMFLTEKYSVRELHRIATEKMGLNSVQRKKLGGKPIKLSLFYRMLEDPFYAGFFFGKDDDGNPVRWEVNNTVPRAITEKQHRKIITLMRRKGNPRPSVYTHEFPYKKFMRCGHCGGSMTAERKIQMICDCKHKFSLPNRTHCPKCEVEISKIKNGKTLIYTYYHCCKKKDPECPGKSIRESIVDEKVLADHVRNLAISESLRDWLINSMVILEQEERKAGKVVDESWNDKLKQQKMSQIKRNLTRPLQLRYTGVTSIRYTF
jgi:DNA invertase Pin-like site-specific DNA recombinase